MPSLLGSFKVLFDKPKVDLKPRVWSVPHPTPPTGQPCPLFRGARFELWRSPVAVHHRGSDFVVVAVADFSDPYCTVGFQSPESYGRKTKGMRNQQRTKDLTFCASLIFQTGIFIYYIGHIQPHPQLHPLMPRDPCREPGRDPVAAAARPPTMLSPARLVGRLPLGRGASASAAAAGRGGRARGSFFRPAILK